MTNLLVRKLDYILGICEDVPLTSQIKTFDDVSSVIPQGAYTTFRTFNHNKVLHLKDHFSRLTQTAILEKFPLSLDQEMIQRNLRRAVQEMGGENLRIRLTVDFKYNPSVIFIAIENLITPSHGDYANGVSVISLRMIRENPKAKLSGFLKMSEAIRTKIPSGINEVVMVDENGFLLEGLSSNFFAVINDQIWTEEEKVLSGITRDIILIEADKAGIKINYHGIHLDQMPNCSEAFLTSTSRSLLPIHSIDNIRINDGKPGEMSKLLSIKFQERVNLEAEEI